MSHQLFEYYREELRFLYEQGRQFSQTHGEEASLLDFDRDDREDPFVRRLVEAFSFLTARVRMKLDDDFPKIIAALMDQLLPLATRPFPAFSVVQLQPDDQVKPGGEFLPRTETRLTLDNFPNVYFRTCYDTQCVSLDIEKIELKRDFPEARHLCARSALSALKISLAGSEGLPLSSAFSKTLRFYISDPNIQYELSELIYNPLNLAGIGFQDEDRQWELPPEQLRVLGFEPEELVLPQFEALPMEYQLLMELFAYPSKHLFFEIPVPDELCQSDGGSCELYFYLKTSSQRLESIVSTKSLALNCSPVINLFKSQPVVRPVDRYCVDSLIDTNTGETDYEIFDLLSVGGVDADGANVEIRPFYAVEHYAQAEEKTLFYHCSSEFRASGDGTDKHISLVDLKLQPAEDNKLVQLMVTPLCCNRRFRDLNMVARSSKSFRILNGGLVTTAERMEDWTRMLMQSSDTDYYWQLVSLLNLNYLLLAGDQKAERLRRILELLDRPSTSMTRSWINSVVNVSRKRVTDRIESMPWGAVADGTGIEVRLDETRSSNRPGSWFLFCCGIDRFFSLHAAINSFTKIDIRAAEDGRHLTRFTKRCGTRNLI